MDEVTEYDVLTRTPEEMTVGKLNKVVRALREKLYQKTVSIETSDEAYNRGFDDGFCEGWEQGLNSEQGD
jgi:hypothetical protein